ncbi:MAG: KamA family radical SAM protein [Methanothrix sp.]|jgi:L-lysine 2,3-aminomutase (EC 5.4.3.2)|uniref:L-lysine 2,3-aminomutase n=1 Tax=Methanothrix thermoacetophila (strain DSM 6194 / JCM 14653 / NBRC 101360 / PT) TaxID=349307 RepID=A0B5G1_METTP|nr:MULTISPECIES: KamA family radical SAM protein [Methanothrix]ABK13935.1 L-lysine 2,3-aminomutase [Methanothrix thermoacetophila PT]MBC7079888.1 KamA family radical SAM protein [Methanothrix sp.]NPU88039.1 KamA family radical SAM protein [Methanothrix sp.]
MRYVTDIMDVMQLKEDERKDLSSVTENFAFRASSYYLSLIDWNDPQDPLRKIVIPDANEMYNWGTKDPSRERSYTVLPGLQHKYRQTALMLVSNACGSLCRFCFRKRIFIDSHHETAIDLPRALDYIREHREITNVLLSGGDPLMLSTERLEEIVRRLRDIDHVQIIRIGTKLPVYNPFRITEDPSLLEIVKRYSHENRRIYFVIQFNHPKEISSETLKAVSQLQEAGAITVSQTPLLRGVNDNPETLAQLFKKLSFIGVSPYYVFQCRPSIGNYHFQVPVETSYAIVEKAKSMCSGLAKRAKFVMSHATGKIEVVGLTDRYVYMKYAQAADPENIGMFMVFERNPAAFWFDDYSDPVDHHRLDAEETRAAGDVYISQSDDGGELHAATTMD